MTPFILANVFTKPVGVSHFLVVGAVLFVCGAVCMATKRNALGVLMGIELVLNGANLNFIAFGSPYLRNASETIGLDGQLMSLFVIVLAALTLNTLH
jgi:NADH-quinone oxidoreductase subunit K